MKTPSYKLEKIFLDGKVVYLMCKDEAENAPRAKKHSRGKLKTKKRYIIYICQALSGLGPPGNYPGYPIFSTVLALTPESALHKFGLWGRTVRKSINFYDTGIRGIAHFGIRILA